MKAAWVILAACVVAGPVWADDADETRAVARPHAGITLTVPDGFESLPLIEMYQLVRAARIEDDRIDEAVALVAIPMAADATAEQFAADMLADMQQQLAFRDVQLLESVDASLAGLDGQRCVIGYRRGGNENVAAALVAIRPMSGSGRSICYLLMTECSSGRRERAVTLLNEVAATVEWTEVTSPMACEVAELAEPIELSAIGCAILRPAGWFAVALPNFVEMGLIDFTVGGKTSPMVRLMARAADAEGGSQAVAGESLAMALQLAEDIGDQATIVHQGPADLGGRVGYEFVLLLTPSGQAEVELRAPADDEDAAADVVETSCVTVVQRCLCVAAADDGAAVAYVLTLVCESGDVPAARAVMDRVAEGFSLLDEPTEDDASDAD